MLHILVILIVIGRRIIHVVAVVLVVLWLLNLLLHYGPALSLHF